MQRPVGRPWFRRRSVGFGWRPVSWQGWLVTSVTVGLLIGAFALMRHSAGRFPIVILIIALYAIVALLTGGARAAASAPAAVEAPPDETLVAPPLPEPVPRREPP